MSTLLIYLCHIVGNNSRLDKVDSHQQSHQMTFHKWENKKKERKKHEGNKKAPANNEVKMKEKEKDRATRMFDRLVFNGAPIYTLNTYNDRITSSGGYII